ncbi:c-type cytochrome [Oryzifoliimicrobium ureilyticus]|uniref:c-type cytochrome n=1 Tax=Oryzifoliimicrobium ureilyticus TaxID=3113724 RepID=UPI0030765FEA
MSFFVVVDTGADFVKWQDVQRSDAPGSAAADALAGKAIFMEKPCAACHAIRGTEARGIAGPDLTHVGSRRTIGAGLLENTRGSLAAWIADPQTLKPGNNMPNVPLTSDELLRVSAYLESLK